MALLEFFMGMVVSPLLQELIDKIKNSTYDQIRHAFSDVEMKLKTLEGSYVRAQSLLNEMDEWDLVTSQPHRDWLGEAIRACYDMDDLTLEVMLELRKPGNALSYLKNWVQSRKIDELQSNLDQVLAKAPDFVNPNRKCSEPTIGTVTRRPQLLPETFLRKRDKENIVRMLLRSTSISSMAGATTSSSSGNRNGASGNIIISIEGMFGLGKSVLAQAVTNDMRIQVSFAPIFWIRVSGDFNLETVQRSMVIQTQNLEQVQEPDFTGTIKSLYKRRILVVLDDLRSFTRHQDWEDFLALLKVTTMFGVLITTRNPNIAKRVSSLGNIPVVPYCLTLMPIKDCQSLIMSRALNKPFKRKRSKREENALKMAEMFCQGLPLVADILSVHFSETEYSLFSVQFKNLWRMPEFKHQIFPAFRLDYSNLPKAVKNCFRYLSLFPENFEFKRQDLVRLWMAEGFIAPAGQPCHQSLEETGDGYFGELLSRSILRIYHPYDEEQQVYTMHEFIHSYAQYVSSDVYLRLDKGFAMLPLKYISNRYGKARHISLLCQRITPSILKGLEKCKALRTLVSPREGTDVGPLSYNLFLELQSLRVLSLSGTDISKLPESIGKLKHLQLLDVSSTVIQDLPASTTSLHELRVLKLTDCRELLRLPINIRHLTYLLHLEIDGTHLPSMPPKIGKLKSLRTLPVFVIGDEDGYLITELKDMEHLEGSICLKDVENVTSYAEAREAMLNNKPLLRKLELEWSSSSIDQETAEEVLNGLEPHENLEELRVARYSGIRFPSWFSSPESELKSIHLQGCHRCSSLPSLGQLQWLTHLHIQGMHGIKYVDHQFSAGDDGVGFPSLVSLKFEGMNNLEKWDGLQATQMSHLCELMITNCPKLVVLPPLNQLTSLKRLDICGCPLLKSLPKEILPFSLESLMIDGHDLMQKIDVRK